MKTPVYDELRAYLPDSWERGDYVLCGSAALAARGERDVGDLDVQVRPALWPEVERLIAAGHWPDGPDKTVRDAVYEEEDAALGRRVELTGRIDFFDRMPRVASCVSADEVFDAAQLKGGYLVVSLRHCLAVKALALRAKDLDDMVRLAQLIRAEEGGPT